MSGNNQSPDRPWLCERCHRPYGMKTHMHQVELILREMGKEIMLPTGSWLAYCPPCRRIIKGEVLAATMGQRWL